MMFKVRCGCGKRLKVRSEHVGLRSKCPSCGVIFIIPQPDPEPHEGRAADSTLDIVPKPRRPIDEAI